MDADDLKKQLADKVSTLARIKRIQESLSQAKEDKKYPESRLKNAQYEKKETYELLQSVEKNIKAAKKTNDKELLRRLENSREGAKEDFDHASGELRGIEKTIKKASDQLKVAQEQLVSLGIQGGEKEAEQKVQAIQQDHSELEAKISNIINNKGKYIEQARKEIAAMQKPVPSLEQSTNAMVSQVLGSIRETDKAIKKEREQERFAASLFGNSFLEPKNRLIIDDFLNRAS